MHPRGYLFPRGEHVADNGPEEKSKIQERS